MSSERKVMLWGLFLMGVVVIALLPAPRQKVIGPLELAADTVCEYDGSIRVAAAGDVFTDVFIAVDNRKGAGDFEIMVSTVPQRWMEQTKTIGLRLESGELAQWGRPIVKRGQQARLKLVLPPLNSSCGERCWWQRHPMVVYQVVMRPMGAHPFDKDDKKWQFVIS